MSIFRPYYADSTGISISGTSAVPALYFAPTSTNDCNLVRIKVAVEGASSPAPPSNGSVLWTLNKVTGTVGGGSAVTPSPTGQSALAANTVVKSGSTALTSLTQGIEIWAQPIPFTSGAWAEETFENTGLEYSLPASGLYCFYFIAASGAGSGCNARIMVNFAE